MILDQSRGITGTMQEAGRPYLIELISSLADNAVAFIICGGMAAVYHGVERMTMDLDISLDMDPENVRRFLKTVHELRLVPRAPVQADSLLDPETLKGFVQEKNARVFTFWDPDSPYRQIDVFLTEDQAYSLLRDHTVTAKVDGRTVRVLSMKKLLSTASFDGHTGFVSLSFTEKLIWLSEAAASVYILARCNPEAGCNAFFDTGPADADPRPYTGSFGDPEGF